MSRARYSRPVVLNHVGSTEHFHLYIHRDLCKWKNKAIASKHRNLFLLTHKMNHASALRRTPAVWIESMLRTIVPGSRV